MTKTQELNTEYIAAAILYRLLEKDEAIPVALSSSKYEFAKAALDGLSKLGAIEANADEGLYEATDKGVELFDGMLDAYEALIDLEVFAGVNLSLELEDELFDEDGHVQDEELDPRFEEPANEDEAETFGTTDLRLPLMDFLAERVCQKQKRSYDAQTRHQLLSRVVFLQEYGNEKFADDTAFFELKLGSFAKEINDIVTSVPPWIELAREFSPPEKLMEMIIDAGFRDAVKREMIAEDSQPALLDASERSKIIELLMAPLSA